jgi:hypothetical protein
MYVQKSSGDFTCDSNLNSVTSPPAVGNHGGRGMGMPTTTAGGCSGRFWVLTDEDGEFSLALDLEPETRDLLSADEESGSPRRPSPVARLDSFIRQRRSWVAHFVSARGRRLPPAGGVKIPATFVASVLPAGASDGAEVARWQGSAEGGKGISSAP